MNALFGFGGLFNTGLTAAQAYKSRMRNNYTANVKKAAAPVTVAKPTLNLYKSKAASALGARTRKQKRVNNLYVPSNTEAPNVNRSYVGNRNESVRNALNEMMVGRSFNGSTPNLTNSQQAARIEVARKMARGEKVNYMDKVRAGIASIPKPKGPKPASPPIRMGGKRSRKVSRRRRTVRRR